MGLDISKVIPLAASNITIGGTNVGHTDEEGAKVTLTGTIIEAMTGQHGQVGVRKWLNGQRVTVEFNIIQTKDNWAVLEKMLVGGTKVTDGSDNKITFGLNAGTEISSAELILKPIASADTPMYDFTMHKAVKMGEPEIVFSGANYQKWACKFEALIDEAGGSDGNWLCSFGKDATTGDAVAPTATVVPVDDAGAVAVGTAVVYTCSEDLDGNTVNTNTVYLLEDAEAAGDGSVVAASVVLVNAGASTTITLTPDSNLTGTTEFTALLTAQVKDKNGNAFTAKVTNFETAA